jgi:hypothetical protein
LELSPEQRFPTTANGATSIFLSRLGKVIGTIGCKVLKIVIFPTSSSRPGKGTEISERSKFLDSQTGLEKLKR